MRVDVRAAEADQVLGSVPAGAVVFCGRYHWIRVRGDGGKVGLVNLENGDLKWLPNTREVRVVDAAMVIKL